MHTKSEEDKPVIRHLYDTLGRGDTDSASPGADVKASKVARAHCHRVGVAVTPETAAREKAVMTRLVLAALRDNLAAVRTRWRQTEDPRRSR